MFAKVEGYLAVETLKSYSESRTGKGGPFDERALQRGAVRRKGKGRVEGEGRMVRGGGVGRGWERGGEGRGGGGEGKLYSGATHRVLSSK